MMKPHFNTMLHRKSFSLLFIVIMMIIFISFSILMVTPQPYWPSAPSLHMCQITTSLKEPDLSLSDSVWTHTQIPGWKINPRSFISLRIKASCSVSETCITNHLMRSDSFIILFKEAQKLSKMNERRTQATTRNLLMYFYNWFVQLVKSVETTVL